ncbi:MAG: PAS domain S-box protein [Clostridia bacterium]|nr:PAS domain S-box protein [Clostridia bacterium]
MTKRIFRAIFVVAVAVFVASLVLIMGVLYGYFSDVQRDQLSTQVDLAAQGITHEGEAYFEGFHSGDDYRITWIAADGTVMYDSWLEPQKMENHIEREEVKQALELGYGESTRYSASTMQRSLYAARRLDDGTVVRLSIAHQSILLLLLGMIQPICLIMAVAVVLSLVLASRLAKGIVKPLNELDLDRPLSNKEYAELTPLLRRIDNQQIQLRQQAYDLQRKQDEWEALTADMTEGLVLLNEKGNILTINTSAKKILGADLRSVGKFILTVCDQPELQEALYSAQTGQRCEKIVKLNGAEYQLDASPVISHGAVSGVVLLLFDVTERRQAEKLRREFTANVSHELKTPLHAISGYAELMKNGMVKQEDIGTFSGRIYTEAHRMIRLIEDIIHLSHLDEGAGDMQTERVDLLALVTETLDELQPQAIAAGITLSVAGEPAELTGVPQLIRGIVHNLCDNAIKYNRPGGSVTVTVAETGQGVTLSVADTGIGIPPKHQSRVFERFYRVDKSHSKEVGGTGLGLSIVKHAVQVLGATLELESTVGVGSTFTVTFPKA